MTKRRKYPKEFKLDAINLVVEQGDSQAEAARNLGINSNMLSRWIRQFQADDENGQSSFRGNGSLTPEQKELRELKKKVKQLETEREILKKATVFFAAKRSEIFVYHPI